MANWEESLYLEHRVAQIISQQEINGWLFDSTLAREHIKWLDTKTEELYDKITQGFGYNRDTKKRTCARPFAKLGGYSAKVEKLIGMEDLPIGGPFTYIKGKLSEKSWVVENLLSRGWKPTLFTDKTGEPKLTDDGDPVQSLLDMEDSIGNDLSDWFTYEKRRATILNRTKLDRGWLNNVRDDGRIPAYANSCGTNTGRMRHRLVANVPKADPAILFGKEMRELFTVPEGKVLIGHDASGLEARITGHYLNDEGLIHKLIYGKSSDGTDFHTQIWNPIRAYIASRGGAKGIEYAMIYGASDRKLGSMADSNPHGWSLTRLGKEIRRLIMESMPALGELTKRVQKAAEKGYLVGLDGRKLYTRSPHSALNVLFQGAGAIVMKKSIVLLDDWIKEEGWTSEEYMKLGDFHDEAQAEVINNSEIIELYSNLAVKSIIEAGKHFNLRCPLDAEMVCSTSTKR